MEGSFLIKKGSLTGGLNTEPKNMRAICERKRNNIPDKENIMLECLDNGDWFC
jgi:hypothetical protein